MKIIIDTGNYELKEGDVLAFHKGKLTFVNKTILFAEIDKSLVSKQKELDKGLKEIENYKGKTDNHINRLSKAIKTIKGAN